jgi:hypothetical protein
MPVWTDARLALYWGVPHPRRMRRTSAGPAAPEQCRRSASAGAVPVHVRDYAGSLFR